MTDKREPAGSRRAAHSKHAPDSETSPEALRRRAEESLINKSSPLLADIDALTPEQARKVLHELQVHQIELEMQNEELRDAQVALDLERARYFDLYDLAPVGYCTISDQGQIMQANLTAASLLGTTRRELLGKAWTRFIHQEDADLYHMQCNKLHAGGEPQSCEFRMAGKDGKLVWVHWSATTATLADGSVEQRAVFYDTTERVRVEAELREAKESADKANRAKSEFLSNMSHELRTPLNAVLGFAQLIKSGKPPPTATLDRNVDYILKAGWYLLALVDEILDLAVIESGRPSLSMDAVSLDEVMRDCQAMVEQQAATHGIHMQFPRESAPRHVHADRKRVKQVLSNLLSNAIKYNRPEGSVVVGWALTDAGRVRISVQDEGDGLSPDELQHLFQPFNRLGKEAGREQGTGIGLVVSKRLVELMGGSIGVQSTVGKGSVFWVELNQAPDPPREGDAARTQAGEPATAGGDAPTRTLLYVEDNQANLALVEAIMSRRPDIHLLTATDAEKGIAIARAALPDVVLMDLNLPDISGTQAMNTLLEDPATAHIPVVALSADATAENIATGIQAGFFSYVTKPIRVEEFLDALDVALEFAGSPASHTTRKRP